MLCIFRFDEAESLLLQRHTNAVAEIPEADGGSACTGKDSHCSERCVSGLGDDDERMKACDSAASCYKRLHRI